MEKYNGQKLDKHAIHLEIRKSLDARVKLKEMGPQQWPYTEEYKETYRLASSYRMTMLCNLLALARGKPTSHMKTIWKKFGTYGMAFGYGDKNYELQEKDIIAFVKEEWKAFVKKEEPVVEAVALSA